MKTITRFIGIGALAATAIATVTPAALAQFGLTAADSQKFAAHDPNSSRAIDFKVVDSVLEAFILDQKSTTIVRYGVIKGEGQRLIEEIVTGFERIDISQFNRDQQLSYWLNLRLLMVLHATSSAYPSANPKSLLASNSVFLNTPLVTVQGVDLTIADVDKIILDNWADNPDVVFGLVVPAKGSPAFPRTSFKGVSVNQTLEAKARQFINRSGIVKPSRSKVRVSSFLQWHKAHLGGDDQAILQYVNRLAAPKLAGKLPETAALEDRFDWKLNVFRERSFSENSDFGFSAGRRSSGGFGGGS